MHPTRLAALERAPKPTKRHTYTYIGPDLLPNVLRGAHGTVFNGRELYENTKVASDMDRERRRTGSVDPVILNDHNESLNNLWRQRRPASMPRTTAATDGYSEP